jgi:16S rRNA (cytidine1402-2'-O)-methyltransferase
LYLVATPIGNLSDIGLRALQVLAQAERVFAEDTRVSRKLLDRFGIARPLEALHQQNESSRVHDLVGWIAEQQCAVALISDAGTPLVSDPGFVLVRSCVARGIPVRSVPGASAVLAALTVSALPCDRFGFEGFLPARHSARLARLREFRFADRTLVFFEAPHRLRETVLDMLEVLGPARKVCVVRELTKMHEAHYRGGLGDVAAAIAADTNAERGEIAIVVGPAEAGDPDAHAATELLGVLLKRVTRKDAVEIASEATGRSRNELYALALTLDKPDAAS